MDSARSAFVSVIIPHLDQLIYLESCLKSLEWQTLGSSHYEIIVVDNGSKSSLVEIMAAHPAVRFLHEDEPGPGPARNRGAAAALGEILCFIDADCRAHPQWLSAAVRALGSRRGLILGGDVQIWRLDQKVWTGIEAYESIFGYRQKLHIEYYGFSGSGNLAVRKDDFNIVGPFRGIDVAEDKEWGARARASGRTFTYVPEMIVYHPARPSLRELCTQWDRLIQHALTAERSRRRRWRLLWFARGLAIACSPIFDLMEVVRSDRIDGISVRVKAFAVLTVIRCYRFWRMTTLLWGSRRNILWNRSVAIEVIDESGP